MAGAPPSRLLWLLLPLAAAATASVADEQCEAKWPADAKGLEARCEGWRGSQQRFSTFETLYNNTANTAAYSTGEWKNTGGQPYPLTADDLDRAWSFRGDMTRLDCVLRRIQAGMEVRIAILGGSMTCGAVVWRHNLPKGTRWGDVWLTRLQRDFPKVDITNLCAGSSSTAWAFANRMPEIEELRPHLIVVDYGVNDGHQLSDMGGSAWRTSLEGSTREMAEHLLGLPWRPAALWLETFCALKKPWAHEIAEGDAKRTKTYVAGCDDGLDGNLTLLPRTQPLCARFYNVQDVHALALVPLGVPTVSYRDVVWPDYHRPPCNWSGSYWNEECAQWGDDSIHPNTITHSLVADVLARALDARTSELACGDGPPPNVTAGASSSATALAAQLLAEGRAGGASAGRNDLWIPLCSDPLTSLLSVGGDVRAFPCHGELHRGNPPGGHDHSAGAQPAPWCCDSVGHDNRSEWCFGEENEGARGKPGWFFRGAHNASVAFVARAPPPPADAQLDVGFMRMHGCVGTVRIRVLPHAAAHAAGGGGGAACEWFIDAHSTVGTSMYESASFHVPAVCFRLSDAPTVHHGNASVWALDVRIDAVPGSDRHTEGCTGLENRFKLTRIVTCAAAAAPDGGPAGVSKI